MATPTARRDLQALRRMIVNADLVLGTIPDPHPSIARSRELLNAAKKLAADLVTRSVPTNAAAALGSKGGSKTAERGPDYYAKIAAMRKTKGGGRPRKPDAN